MPDRIDIVLTDGMKNAMKRYHDAESAYFDAWHVFTAETFRPDPNAHEKLIQHRIQTEIQLHKALQSVGWHFTRIMSGKE